MKRIESPFNELLHRFGDRSREWETALRMMMILIKMGTCQPEIGLAQLDAMDKGADVLLDNIQKAKRGFSNSLNFNPGLGRLVKELKKELSKTEKELKELKAQVSARTQTIQELHYWKTQHEITQKELEQERKERALEKAGWQKNLGELDQKWRERRRQDKAELEELRKQDKRELEVLLQKQEETINQLKKIVSLKLFQKPSASEASSSEQSAANENRHTTFFKP